MIWSVPSTSVSVRARNGTSMFASLYRLASMSMRRVRNWSVLCSCFARLSSCGITPLNISSIMLLILSETAVCCLSVTDSACLSLLSRCTPPKPPRTLLSSPPPLFPCVGDLKSGPPLSEAFESIASMPIDVVSLLSAGFCESGCAACCCWLALSSMIVTGLLPSLPDSLKKNSVRNFCSVRHMLVSASSPVSYIVVGTCVCLSF
mmetsp:Transcript_2891/g.5351  ORF Transcript_2891/g.5351 Transcript_2891/m.5351 type:complete len:205 (+) Transcript_2891:1052-1666(+)